MDAGTLRLRDGREMPALGLGTWRLGESPSAHTFDLAAVRLALEIGYRMVDTAEAYADGGAERLVGQALSEALRAGTLRREELFLVSKVSPQNADPLKMLKACEASRRRLGVDRIDLYLLHWRGPVPLDETVRGFEKLMHKGWIGGWGVCGFRPEDFAELHLSAGASMCIANQARLSLLNRGAGDDALDWQRERGLAFVASSPLDRGSLPAHPLVLRLARRLGLTPAQLCLGWLLQQGAAVVPKARHATHLVDNFAAGRQRLDGVTMAALDRLFPRPRKPSPLLAA